MNEMDKQKQIEEMAKIIAEQKAEIERLKSACECFQEMILSMQGGTNNGKGVMIIHEVK